MTQQKFAEVAGISRKSQVNYENGERTPDAEYLAAIAKEGVDVGYIVTGVRTPQAGQGQSQVQETGGEYRVVTPKQAAILDLLDGLGDDALRDVQAVAEKEKLLKELQADLADIKRKVGNGGA
jgi:transcriptional regulator with XRE-family HTH domain